MKKPARLLLKNHRGCAYCSDAEMVIDDKGPLVGYAFYELLEAENARLKSEVERLRKAGDAVALDYAERIEIEAGETAKTLMKTVPVLREWNAAKEGKPSV